MHVWGLDVRIHQKRACKQLCTCSSAVSGQRPEQRETAAGTAVCAPVTHMHLQVNNFHRLVSAHVTRMGPDLMPMQHPLPHTLLTLHFLKSVPAAAWLPWGVLVVLELDMTLDLHRCDGDWVSTGVRHDTGPAHKQREPDGIMDEQKHVFLQKHVP